MFSIHAPKEFEHWLIKLDGVSDEEGDACTGYSPCLQTKSMGKL